MSKRLHLCVGGAVREERERREWKEGLTLRVDG
jgi:hypothetical protein